MTRLRGRIESVSHNARRITDSDCVCGNIACDDRRGADQCPLADRDPAEYGRPSSDPNISTNMNSVACSPGTVGYPGRKDIWNADFVYSVIISADDLYSHANKCIVADLAVHLHNRVRSD